MRRGYLGIDESNHGRFPEIFVAVYSEHLDDIREKPQMPKIRKRGAKISDIIAGREFKHILIPEAYRSILGENSSENIKVVAFSEFIQRYDNLETILIDGELREGVIERLQKTLYPRRLPKFVAESKADTKYPIVNRADQIAHMLFRYYTQRRNADELSKYLDYLITPKIENYTELFK